MIKAAIFDMDGLLIDSEPFWREAHIRALKDFGRSVSEDEIRALAGMRTLEIAHMWVDRFSLNVSAQDLADHISSTVANIISQNGVALPGVGPALKLFTDHQIPMGVASSATPANIAVVLDRLQIHDYFRVVHSAIDEPAGKPHPAVFLTTARLIGVNPADCLVFEDAVIGVQAAKAAGMKCIAVPEPSQLHNPQFEEADLVLDSLESMNWIVVEKLFA